MLSRVMDENLGGIRVVRAFAAQRHEMEKFDRASQDALELANERVDIRVINTSAMNFSFFAAMGLVLWFGGKKVIAGQISVGTLAAVPHLHDHPADAGAPARPDGQLVRPRLDLRHAAVRLARRSISTSRTRLTPGSWSSPRACCASTMSASAMRARATARRCPASPSRPGPARRSASSARRAAASRPSRT